MKFPSDLIIFDLEFTQPTQFIIEIGAIRVKKDGQIRDSFSSLVKPPPGPLGWSSSGVSITELTGITPQKLDHALPFDSVMVKFEAWARKETSRVTLAAWGGDVQVLVENYKYHQREFPFRRANLDIKSMAVFYTALLKKPVKSHGLAGYLRTWGLPFNGKQHEALADAKNTAKLLQIMIRYHESLQQRVKSLERDL